MTASNSITLDMLRPHFEEPLAKVAASFGICVTLLKKICRRHGIARWPHRQITGLRKSIASMEHAIGYFDGIRRESYAEQLLKQKKKLAALLDDPTINNPLLAHEDEMTNGLTNALPLHQIESGHNVKPAPTNHHALSPRGPLPMESPQYTVPSVAISSQMSSMCPPAAFYIEQSYTPEFHQTCSPHVYMQSRPEAYLSMRYYNRGATNSVSSTSLSPIYQLPPLRRESRPMLPPISSLVAVRNNSIYSS
ncbi:RWP-RK domain [Plasmopara halstedii]|uniref:RWP-RK domain n=1 Tax=Plasmopara halstedii TaxID=4781 RepID=A0A0P1B5E5_PLAHL|nr:RWP-RK domain [Plasmopara halstedii]CEG48879.1 RWP-RK domain [Plasmopara halstedii]|eukprot:XP_024585248.1 RWP-RK domain [Plasmopara halstedii]